MRFPLIISALLSLSALVMNQSQAWECWTPASTPSGITFCDDSGQPLSNGLVTSQTTGTDPWSEPSMLLHLDAGSESKSAWLRCEIPMQNETDVIFWWMNSRGLPWIQIEAVIANPSGDLRSFSSASCGDSPWSRYRFSVSAWNEGTLLPASTTQNGWRFMGWILRLSPYQSGPLEIGMIETDRQAAQPASWSFRDVDESLKHQGAYSGFNIGYDADRLPLALPVKLLLPSAQAGEELSWLLWQGDSALLAGQFSLSRAPGLQDTLLLPVLTEGHYWFSWTHRDTNGFLISQQAASLLIHTTGSEAPTPLTPIDPVQYYLIWPETVSPCWEISGDATIVPVALKEIQAGDSMTIQWLDGMDRVVETTTIALQAAAQTVDIPTPQLTPAQRYSCAISIQRNGAQLAQRTGYYLIQGSAGSPLPTNPPAGSNSPTLTQIDTKSIFDPAGRQSFISFLATLENNSVSLSLNWDEIEPEEGFIQYAVIDELLAMADAAQVPVTFTLYCSLDHLPRWLWYEQLLDQNQRNEHYTATYIRKASPASQKTLDALKATIAALMTHYADYDGIIGWNFSQGVESFWSDASRRQKIVGYSDVSRHKFADFLQTSGWTLSDVNAAAQTTYASWDEVQIPQPIFNGELDLSPLWLAFEAYKQQRPTAYFTELLSWIRSFDADKEITIYGGMGAGDMLAYLSPFEANQVNLGFGGGGSAVAAMLQSLAMQTHVSIHGEPAGVPPRLADVNTTVFQKLAYGNREAGFHIMWGRFFSPSQTETIAAVSDLNEMLLKLPVAMGSPENCGTAIGLGMQSIINHSRSMMWIDWVNLDTYRFSSMLNCVVGQSAQVGFVTDHSTLDQLTAWPALIWQESPILSDEAAHRLNSYVRQGGKLVVQGEQTGSLNAQGQPTTQLQDLLGISADGVVHTIGNGQAQWLQQPITWSSWKSRIENELAWLALQQPVIAFPTPSTRVAMRKDDNAETRWILLFGKTWSGGNPSAAQLSASPESVLLQCPTLPQSMSWTVVDILSETIIGTYSSAELAAGISVNLSPAQLRIFSLGPVQ